MKKKYNYKVICHLLSFTISILIIQENYMNKGKKYVYILTNQSNEVMYVGVTSNLIKRMEQHRQESYRGFTSKYNVKKLVHYETFLNINDAIHREKQLKNWKRKWKNELVDKFNPFWGDIYPLLQDYNPTEDI